MGGLDDVLRDLRPRAVCIDSGFNTDAVLRFTKDRFRRRVYAVKGIAGPGRPIWPKRPSRNNRLRAPMFMVGVDSAKFTIYPANPIGSLCTYLAVPGS